MASYPKIEELLGHSITAMSRGRIVVDENLAGIIPFLREKNLRVETPDKGQKDPTIIRDKLIGNRIFVTNNSKDFVRYAAETETWIIATENVRKFYTDQDLANLISETLREMQLLSKPVTGGILIRLQHDAIPTVEILAD